MSKSKMIFAMMAVGALVAGPAFAQSKTEGVQAPKSGSQPSSSTEQSKPGSSTDTQQPSSAQAPSSSTDSQRPSSAGTQRPSTESQPSTAETPKSPKGSDMKSADTQMKSERQKGMGGKAMSKERDQSLKAAQQALKDKGHDPGSIDGVMGPRTARALKDFQKAEGLQATGQLDSQTREKLGVEGSAKRQ